MILLRRAIKGLAGILMLLAIGFALYAFLRNRPQDVPWTPLDLGQHTGLFTGRKLAALDTDFAECRALLDKAGVRYSALSPAGKGGCSYADGVRLHPGGPDAIAFSPSEQRMSCPVAAGLLMWQWNVLQPAAQRYFGSPVERILHYGSYSCRRLYGRATGPWSEHATADAIDVAGFVLKDGTRITVTGDWGGKGVKAQFLHTVRDGACGLFSTVLSPDYNRAHHDHLHLDQARRGAFGGRVCR